MNNKLDEQLVKDFPLLFGDRHGDMQNTAMCWGFEVGDGWEPIIREAAEKLEPLIKKYNEETNEKDYLPRASQIKEKFGTLRFYMTCTTDEMDKITNEAENKSEVTCEQCGEKGELATTGGWLMTRCKKHLPDNAKFMSSLKKQNEFKTEVKKITDQ